MEIAMESRDSAGVALTAAGAYISEPEPPCRFPLICGVQLGLSTLVGDIGAMIWTL